MMLELSEMEARAIYEQRYIQDPGFNKLPEHLQDSVIDHGVNAGPRAAVRILQRAAGVQEDGILGPKTLAAARGVSRAQYTEARVEYYEAVVERRPETSKYLNGWISRAQRYNTRPPRTNTGDTWCPPTPSRK
jgi:lysozyme family protein